jgi:OmpA-OmpF porin, OOP family
MRKLAITIALASTGLATPAMAQDRGFYAGVNGGLLLVQDPNWDYADTNVAVNDAYNIDLNNGFDGDVVVGYDLGMIRVEGELGYKRATVDTATVDPVITSIFTGIPFEADGRSSALSAMLNVFFDIDAGGWGAYAGGGSRRRSGQDQIRHRRHQPRFQRD